MMSLMEELRAEYKKAYEEKQKKISKVASQKYNSIIERIKFRVKKAEDFITFSSDMFGGDYEIKEATYEMLKKDGFIINDDNDYGLFEISGWATEESPWTKALKE